MKQVVLLLRDVIKGLIWGGAAGLVVAVSVFTVMAFSEPPEAPAITAPTDADDDGTLTTLIGTPNSTATSTTSVFGYLRTVFESIGGTVTASSAASGGDSGPLYALFGTSATAANGQTIFNYLKNIDDNLDFPEVENVLSSDTVKGQSGTLTGGSFDNSTTTQAAGYYAAADLATVDTDLVAGNIISSANIFGVTGTVQIVYCDDDGDGYYSSSQKLASSCTGGYQVAVGNDCDDSDNTVWAELTGYVDGDGDGYGAGSGTQYCTTSLPSGYAATNTDCMDNNSSVNPGQTNYFSTNRGDGSFDYNCDGLQTKQFVDCQTTLPWTSSCVGAGGNFGQNGWLSVTSVNCGSSATRRMGFSISSGCPVPDLEHGACDDLIANTENIIIGDYSITQKCR